MSKVFFTKNICSESLIRIYESLNVKLKGKVAVKISTGEPGGHNFLNPMLIKDLVSKVDGTLVECCTAYGGKRMKVEDHLKVFKDHGFSSVAKCDLMDSEGEIKIPIKDGFVMKEDIVGSHLANYDSLIILSHFKGHAMGGFGGALKNMSIGIASSRGKANIHSGGKVLDPSILWDNLAEQDTFLCAMADACKGVIDYMKSENIVYISVLNNLSIDCDCDSNPSKPEMADIGIMASTDPVALDQACYDAIKNSDDPHRDSLIERMDSRHAIYTVECAEKHGLGSRKYEIVCID